MDGEDFYTRLRAQKEVRIRTYRTFLNLLRQGADSSDEVNRIVAKQLFMHAANYTELINPKREELGTQQEDEAIFLSYGLTMLLDKATHQPLSKLELDLLQPRQVQDMLSAASRSMFWGPFHALMEKDDQYERGNDAWRDLGATILAYHDSSTQRIGGRVSIHPVEEYKFGGSVFFNLKASMRGMSRIIQSR